MWYSVRGIAATENQGRSLGGRSGARLGRAWEGARKRIETLTRALEERPALGLELEAIVDAARDLEALRRAAPAERLKKAAPDPKAKPGAPLRVLTVLHNYFIPRHDGTTAAERFLGKQPPYLFERLLGPRSHTRPASPRSRRTSRFFLPVFLGSEAIPAHTVSSSIAQSILGPSPAGRRRERGRSFA